MDAVVSARVECLKLALEVARAKGQMADENTIARIAEGFYTFAVASIATEATKSQLDQGPKKRGRRPKADKGD